MANYSKEELQYIASQVQPYLLELVKANGLDVDTIEVVEDTDGITTLPAYDNRGGTKKVVRVPLSTFAKPAQDAADALDESISKANEAATNANTAADKANASVEEINGIKGDIEQSIADAQKAVEDANGALDTVNGKIDEINLSESERQTAEQSRVDAEQSRVSEFDALKVEIQAVITDSQSATDNANETADHPTYIGEDHYVYKWNKQSKTYDKTDINVKGEAFSIKKVWSSVAEMGSDTASYKEGDFGLVNTGDVEDPDNAKLYVYQDGAWKFLVDMSGAIGFTGKTPQFTIGEVSNGDDAVATITYDGTDENGNPKYKLNLVLPKGDKGDDGLEPILEIGSVTTVEPDTEANAELVENGMSDNGNPKYLLNLSIPRGKKGENGEGAGNVLVSPDGLVSGKTYLFKPNQDNSAEGTFVEYEMSQFDTSTLATKTELSQGLTAKQDTINDLETIRSGASKGTTAVQPSELASVAKSGSYNDLTNKPAIPSAVTESTVSGWGFTKNTGTYSKPSGGIPKSDLASAVQESLNKADTALQSYTEQYKGTVTGVKINGTTKYPSSGTVDLGTVITAHQDIRGKQDKLVSGTNIKTINGQSLLGSGNIDACAYPVVNHGTNDTTFTLTPNTYHIWGKVTSLNLSLGNEVSGVVNEYVFQYSVGDSAPTLTFPETIVWVNPPTDNKVNTTYIVSIVNNIGLIVRT